MSDLMSLASSKRDDGSHVVDDDVVDVVDKARISNFVNDVHVGVQFTDTFCWQQGDQVLGIKSSPIISKI